MDVSAGKSIKETLSGQSSLLAELTAQALEPRLARLGITFSTFELLTSVRIAGRQASQADVARRLGITPPSLTEAVRLAVKAGLIEQTASLTDGRSKTLSITPLGTRKLQEILSAVNEAEKLMVEGISVQDLSVAIDVLKTASRNLARGMNVSDD